MKQMLSLFPVLLLAVLVPGECYAAAVNRGNFSTYAHIISYTNVALEITSVICIKQFFFPGESNKIAFQIFNLIFGILFYIVALNFLVSAKQFYVGFETLSASQCITKFFFGMGIYSVLQWLVIVGMVINIIYIKKYRDA